MRQGRFACEQFDVFSCAINFLSNAFGDLERSYSIVLNRLAHGSAFKLAMRIFREIVVFLKGSDRLVNKAPLSRFSMEPVFGFVLLPFYAEKLHFDEHLSHTRHKGPAKSRARI